MPVISIIDDDASVREGTLMLLQSLGFAARAFASARAFLESGDLADTSCLISDVHMPHMSGLELQDALRAAGHKVPIIFITAYPDAGIRTRAMNNGATGFLEKPVAVDALSRCIDAALNGNKDKSG